MNALFDRYGALLTSRQREVFRYHYEQDLSMQEIADELKISKAAVSDMVRRTEKALEEYEEKLGCCALWEKLERLGNPEVERILDEYRGN